MLQSCKVKLCAPFIKGKSLDNIQLTAILAREIAPSQGVNPIEWLLLTTLDVETTEEAFEKVRWYSYRWRIERFHYILKSGCKIEELQLETGDRLKDAIALYSFLAWRLAWITYQARETPNLPCTLILRDHEWKALYCQVYGTNRLPEKPPSLKKAVLLIALLGGFLNRKSDALPVLKYYGGVFVNLIVSLKPIYILVLVVPAVKLWVMHRVLTRGGLAADANHKDVCKFLET